MRKRVLFALTVVAALGVVATAEATWPRMYSGGSPMYTVPATPTYMSGTVIGGPMYASTGETYTLVERTGPFGIFRRQVLVATPVPIMPAPITMTTTGTPMPSTGVAPASATTTAMPPTTTAGVITSGYVIQPTSTTTIMPATYTVVERTGPFGIFRRRVMIPTPAPIMPAPMTTGSTGTPMSSNGVSPASATTTTAGVVTGGYIVPPAGTMTIMPATYTYRPFFRRGMTYSTMPMAADGATYSTTPGSVVTATYTTPDMPTTTYVYPRRYFGWSGFGFWTR